MSEVSTNSTSSRRFKFELGVRTDVGCKREENQDSHGHAHTSEASVFVVADGMGGAKGGASASAIAVEQILKSVFTEDAIITEGSIRQGLIGANQVIFAESRISEELNGMGTTAVVLAFVNEQLIIGHVGDSRAYLVRGGKLTRLTRDHTLVQELVDTGAIEQDDAKTHPIAHMLTRSLGPAEQVDADVITYYDSVQESDVFLLCCDGLYNLVTDPEIEEVLKTKPPQAAAEALVNLALERGGNDNITVEVVQVRSVNDETCSFHIPEPGKVRLITSRDAPPLKASSTSVADTEEVEAKPQKKKKKDRKRAVDEVIFTAGGELKEEQAEEPEEVADAQPPEPPVPEEELKEVEELWKLQTAGIIVVLLVLGTLSYLFLVRKSSAPVLEAKPVLVATTTTIPTVAPTEVPTPAIVTSSIDDILGEIEEARRQEESEAAPRFILSEKEQTTLRQTLSLTPPTPYELKSAYPMVSEDLPEEEYTPRILSEAEKQEISTRKRALRSSLFNVNRKLQALDSVSRRELNDLMQLWDGELAELETLEDRLEDRLRELKDEQRMWESKERTSGPNDPVRVASEIQHAAPTVRSVLSRLKTRQEKYQEVVNRWNSDRSNQDLIAQTAALSREMKVDKSDLEEAVKKAISSGQENSSAEIARINFSLDQIRERQRILRESSGSLKALEPNVSGRNVERIKSYLSERVGIERSLRELERVMPESVEREYLKALMQ